MCDKTSRAKTMNEILFGTLTGNDSTRYGIANVVIAKEQLKDLLKQKIQSVDLIADKLYTVYSHLPRQKTRR